jgi:hypothetical protein
MESHFNSIVSIREKTTNTPIQLSSCSIQSLVAKYSNTKEPIAKLVIEGKPISRNNSYLIIFTCGTCKAQREITLNLFMRRVSKNTKRCELCVNKDADKCNNHSEFMVDNFHSIMANDYTPSHEKPSEFSLEQHLAFSQTEWEKEDPRIVESYYFNHLSNDDFERIRPKIVSIGNGKLTSLEGWIYFPIYRVFNQTRFTPMLVNMDKMCVEKPLYIEFECENCGLHFTHRDLHIVKNKLKLFCQTCLLTNYSFKLRRMILPDRTSILWQSQPEKRFIEWCTENNLSVKNGPSISYEFNGKPHVYRVDFELPSLKKLVEIKDNHCWHLQQVSSGKFGAKESAALEWCKKNGYEFHILFPKNIQEFKDSVKPCKI